MGSSGAWGGGGVATAGLPPDVVDGGTWGDAVGPPGGAGVGEGTGVGTGVGGTAAVNTELISRFPGVICEKAPT